jgi:hypothetical protein
VIDTIGQKVGPLSMIDRFGTPFSTALHVIERYRLIDGAMARNLQRKPVLRSSGDWKIAAIDQASQ